MKIAIISDIHDNLVNLRQILDWSEKNSIETLICCGDITDDDTLDFLAKKFSGPIHLVRGNIEYYDPESLKKYKNIDYLGKSGIRTIGAHIVGICHEPGYIERLLEKKEAQIIFFGHTHKPWIEDRSGVKIVNPGTVAGTFSRPTFAYWDTETGKLELKMLELI